MNNALLSLEEYTLNFTNGVVDQDPTLIKIFNYFIVHCVRRSDYLIWLRLIYNKKQ
jgi:hypothetical protein